MKKNVGILIFDDAEVLDFAGPFEVFAVASEVHDFSLYDVFTVARHMKPVRAVNGLLVTPNYDFSNHPPIDILIVSGGQGTRALLRDQEHHDWLQRVHRTTEYTLSICSAARIFGALGLLDRKPYCTHHQVYDHLKELVPTGQPQNDRRFVQTDERLYTSGGISAGIDLSFHILEQRHGKEAAVRTAEYMEYRYTP